MLCLVDRFKAHCCKKQHNSELVHPKAKLEQCLKFSNLRCIVEHTISIKSAVTKSCVNELVSLCDMEKHASGVLNEKTVLIYFFPKATAYSFQSSQ